MLHTVIISIASHITFLISILFSLLVGIRDNDGPTVDQSSDPAFLYSYVLLYCVFTDMCIFCYFCNLCKKRIFTVKIFILVWRTYFMRNIQKVVQNVTTRQWVSTSTKL